MSEPFIHLDGVAKTYGSGATAHLAISDATFDVMPGELACLVGLRLEVRIATGEEACKAARQILHQTKQTNNKK